MDRYGYYTARTYNTDTDANIELENAIYKERRRREQKKMSHTPKKKEPTRIIREVTI